MCDYSLMMLPNRLAAEGERLMAHRFRSGTTGLVSVRDFANWKAARPVRLWQRLKNCFCMESEPAPVVCIPSGAMLRLEDISQSLRDRFHLNWREDALFSQISAQESEHRDALLFGNGHTILLQSLSEGQVATVLTLSGEPRISPDQAELAPMPGFNRRPVHKLGHLSLLAFFVLAAGGSRLTRAQVKGKE